MWMVASLARTLPHREVARHWHTARRKQRPDIRPWLDAEVHRRKRFAVSSHGHAIRIEIGNHAGSGAGHQHHGNDTQQGAKHALSLPGIRNHVECCKLLRLR